MSNLFFVAMIAVLGGQTQSTDTTIQVARGMRLQLRNQAGQVNVTTWNRDAVRISAEHDRSMEIDVDVSRSVIRVRALTGRGDQDENDRRAGIRQRRAEARGGRGGRNEDAVHYDLTVPAYMNLDLTGIELDISVFGTSADITAETIEGSVEVHGGNGLVVVKSVEEDIIIDGATGRVRASSSDGNVWIRNVTGDVDASSVDGNLELDRVDAREITATTVDGNVTFSGPIHDDGRYHFSTHEGEVSVAIPAGTNAAVTVASYEGDFESSFPILLRGTRRSRFDFTLGDGSAILELESFEGDIKLRRIR